ncbi:MAG: VWA domain-containing protein [Phycisphaerales bacterium JB038]
MHWAFPGALLLFLLLPAALLLALRPKRRAALLYSSLSLLGHAGPSWRLLLRPLLLVLRLACLALLVVALARPQEVLSETQTRTEGIAIMAVIDRSSSMAERMEFEGALVNRLSVVKQVLAEFVLGNDAELRGRPGDLIGLVSFARYADTICPLVHAHDALVGLAKQTEIVQFRQEDGTAIGDALALAVARLQTLEKRNDKELQEAVTKTEEGEDSPLAADSADTTNFQIKSKIIVLLTDGENNAGQRSPGQAAELARRLGMKIYTVGIGSPRGSSLFGNRLPLGIGIGIDERMLKAIADHTGGAYFRADDGESLRKVYATIDELEKTEIESTEYVQYEEAFMPLAKAALLVLLAEILLSTTLLRRSP